MNVVILIWRFMECPRKIGLPSGWICWLPVISPLMYTTAHRLPRSLRISAVAISAPLLPWLNVTWNYKTAPGSQPLFICRRLLFDYYRRNPRRHCDAMPPGVSYQTSQIWPKPTKPLEPNGFPFACLMPPITILSPTKLWHSNHCGVITLEFWFLQNMNLHL